MQTMKVQVNVFLVQVNYYFFQAQLCIAHHLHEVYGVTAQYTKAYFFVRTEIHLHLWHLAVTLI